MPSCSKRKTLEAYDHTQVFLGQIMRNNSALTSALWHDGHNWHLIGWAVWNFGHPANDFRIQWVRNVDYVSSYLTYCSFLQQGGGRDSKWCIAMPCHSLIRLNRCKLLRDLLLHDFIAFAMETLASLCTIITTTSPTPSNPSTELICSTLESLAEHAPELFLGLEWDWACWEWRCDVEIMVQFMIHELDFLQPWGFDWSLMVSWIKIRTPDCT